MAVPLGRWTISDYHHMIAVGVLGDRRVELLNRLILETASEGPDHADLSTGAAEFFILRSRGFIR